MAVQVVTMGCLAPGAREEAHISTLGRAIAALPAEDEGAREGKDSAPALTAPTTTITASAHTRLVAICLLCVCV
jgi:hypothetical protein